jgi:transcriptional regulator with XRE-family HTH domain
MKKQPPPIPAKLLHRAHAENMMRIRVTLNEIVDKSGLTQQEIARRMGVTHSYVNRVLNGKDSVTLLNMNKFAFALGYQMHLMFQES